MVDDLLDFTASGTALAAVLTSQEGKVTMPLIYAMENAIAMPALVARVLEEKTRQRKPEPSFQLVTNPARARPRT